MRHDRERVDAVAKSTREVLAAIAADVAAGVVPWDVPDFSSLHDFVDANQYLLDTTEGEGTCIDQAGTEADDDYMNDVCDAVNTALSGRGPRWNRWREDPEGYAAWLAGAKRALLASRAAYFGMSESAMRAHDTI
jgi:hypothetical protein